MTPEQNNFACIDGANLHNGVVTLGWHLDYARFRVWLAEKYAVKRAYLFLGLVPRYKDLYKYLQEVGYTLVFKETVNGDKGNVKGNCDADLVLQATRDFFEKKCDQTVLVSSDGDYASLVKFLIEKGIFRVILSPGLKCSVLLKRTSARISYLHDQRTILEAKKEKAPNMDKTISGSFS
ncbi:MAG TPA: hypothetical protein DDW36_02340 [Candidatus Magasanikbacteria bacterium]|nr:hypothetical protein [Candidatus Magasanikbacteria bacterium]